MMLQGEAASHGRLYCTKCWEETKFQLSIYRRIDNKVDLDLQMCHLLAV